MTKLPDRVMLSEGGHWIVTGHAADEAFMPIASLSREPSLAPLVKATGAALVERYNAHEIVRRTVEAINTALASLPASDMSIGMARHIARLRTLSGAALVLLEGGIKAEDFPDTRRRQAPAPRRPYTEDPPVQQFPVGDTSQSEKLISQLIRDLPPANVQSGGAEVDHSGDDSIDPLVDVLEPTNLNGSPYRPGHVIRSQRIPFSEAVPDADERKALLPGLLNRLTVKVGGGAAPEFHIRLAQEG